ncbi:MAG: chromate resistance protein ChrB domain-containing protein [Pseudomonadota bacterium]
MAQNAQNFNTTISCLALMQRLGRPDSPCLVDVSIDEDVATDPFLLPTAMRWSHLEIDALAPRLQGAETIVICQKGRKLSQGAAALLRASGVIAKTLEGGHFGWRDAGLPRLPIAKVSPSAHGSLWVAGANVQANSLAALWLVKRFIDRNARILFVDRQETSDVAAKFGARVLYDTGSVEAPARAFDQLLSTFGLVSAPLHRMAQLIAPKETGDGYPPSQAAGVLAVIAGIARLYQDDLARVAAGMSLFDALYQWSLEPAAQAERMR